VNRLVEPQEETQHMAIDFELDGKKALVTGGGQGVGRAICLLLAEAGATVVVNDFVADRANAVVGEIEAAGGKALASPFDVTDLESVTDAVSAVEGVDILVNNAGNQGAEGGMGTLSSFHETSPADWHKYFAVNTFGVMNCVHAALPGMISAKWGRIVTIISDASRHGEPSMAAYGAAKAGAAGFMRCIAQEGGRHGITANCISLGTMRTPMTEAMWADPNMADRQKAMMRPYVVRRPGEPDDPAWVVAMLASPRAAWITGQTYPVNGGYTFAL
jgi:NAD(P)-dependent dehydrogenase (short-subunit alcohol dehydrogenase family)